MDADYEKPHKEMDFPSAKFGRMPANSKNRNLRINTYSRTELHDRYMSSEEEPSPSPDGDGSPEEELKHKSSVKLVQKSDNDYTVSDGQAAIAIAVPILSLGRPKLVDITNTVPLRKRKQRIPKSQMPHSAYKLSETRTIAAMDESTPFPASEAAELVTTPVVRPAQGMDRRENRATLTAPASWLPDDDALRSDDEHYFPELDIRRTPSYRDYDPFSLDPPRLTVSSKASCARGTSSSLSTSVNPSAWKGLTRSLSLAKKSGTYQRLPKKPKMVVRGANEREGTLAIPPFPFGDEAV